MCAGGLIMSDKDKLREQFKYQLDRYISAEQNSEIEGNTCDYKGTSQASLDRIRENAKNQFEQTLDLLVDLSPQQITSIKNLCEYRRKGTYGTNEFCSFFLRSRTGELGYQMRPKLCDYVGPRWLSFYDEYVDLRRIIHA